MQTDTYTQNQNFISKEDVTKLLKQQEEAFQQKINQQFMYFQDLYSGNQGKSPIPKII